MSDPKRFAGKIGVDSGPVPLHHWRGGQVTPNAIPKPPDHENPKDFQPRRKGGTK